eukprot:s1917_g8.t1
MDMVNFLLIDKQSEKFPIKQLDLQHSSNIFQPFWDSHIYRIQHRNNTFGGRLATAMAMSLDLMKPTLPAQPVAFTVPHIFSFSKGQSVTSPLQGPAGSFKYCLLIFPAGTEVTSPVTGNAQAVSVFVKISPPEHLRDNWTCPDVRYSVSIKSLQRSKPDIDYKDKFTFCKENDDRGWHDMFKFDSLRDYVSPDGALRITGIIHNLPYVHPPPEPSKPLFPGLDFSMEAKMLSFRLAEGASLFFDQRLLMARSEYFRTMLASDEWQESKKGEVDFTGDPHVTKQIMQAILHFILTDSFPVGSVEFNRWMLP